MHATENLVRMAHQIAKNFAAYHPEKAVEKVYDHLKAYWEPRMKTALFHHIDQGHDDLPHVVKEAAKRLKDTQ